MYCSNCGNQIDDRAVVCVGCGVAVGKKYRNARKEKEPFQITKYHAPIIIAIISLFVLACMSIILFIVEGLTALLVIDSIACIATAIGLVKAAKQREHHFIGVLLNGIGISVSLVLAAVLLIVFNEYVM